MSPALPEVLPFICLDGSVAPPMVVLSGTAIMQAWRKVWADAFVTSSPKGSVTTESFAEFFLIWCRHVREAVPACDREIVLLLDSGGGGMIHMSSEIALLSEKYGVRPFWLLPYLTKAVMPLDQKPNREYERRWSQIRTRSADMGPLAALDAAHECWDAGYNRDNVISGWRDAGIVHGESLRCEHLIQTRGPQLFKKLLGQEELQYETDEAKHVFERPTGYVRASEYITCEKCSHKVHAGHKFCPHCKADNPKFSEIALAVSKGSKTQGYSLKGGSLADVQAELASIEPSKKANLSKIWGDLVSKVSAVSAQQESTAPLPQPTAVTPSSGINTSKPEKSSSSKDPPVKENKVESQTDLDEFDLDCPEQAEQYIPLFFSEKIRAEAQPAVRFFISEKKAAANKKETLSHILQKEILKTNVLAKPDGRKKWLQAWQWNRGIRYVAKPHFAK